MIKSLLSMLVVVFFISCSGTYQENQKRLDELYGKCNNPLKPLNERQKRICLAEERAGGESLFGLAEGNLGDVFGGSSEQNVIYQSPVNSYLWRASLEITSSYPLKIADSQGGYIETDWIIDKNNQTQRCIIKINIFSAELISTAVASRFICENKSNDLWVSDNNNYSEEEKQLTLKILKLGNDLANTAIQ